jgi:hypothetical protein
MNARSVTMPALLAASAIFIAAPARAAVVFQIQIHFASSPISLAVGQTASSCAVNADSETVPTLIARLAADNSTLLAMRQAILQPGVGVCLNYTPTIAEQRDSVAECS